MVDASQTKGDDSRYWLDESTYLDAMAQALKIVREGTVPRERYPAWMIEAFGEPDPAEDRAPTEDEIEMARGIARGWIEEGALSHAGRSRRH